MPRFMFDMAIVADGGSTSFNLPWWMWIPIILSLFRGLAWLEKNWPKSPKKVPRSSPPSPPLRAAQVLRCDTLDDCRRIQAGYLPLRRLGKRSVLFTVAITLLINDVIALCVDSITLQYQHAREQYNQVTGSVLYRWTVGWLIPPADIPELDQRALTLYSVMNGLQFLFFLGCCAYCLRWVYADFRVEGNPQGFTTFCWTALFTNLGLYLFLKTWVSASFGS